MRNSKRQRSAASRLCIVACIGMSVSAAASSAQTTAPAASESSTAVTVTTPAKPSSAAAPAAGEQASSRAEPPAPNDPGTAPKGSHASIDDSAAPRLWRLEVTLWAWLIGINGDVGVRGRTADVDASFIDTVEASDSILAFSGRIEAGYGRWGAFIDGLYSKIGADDESGPNGGSADIEYQMGLVDFGAMFRLGQWEPRGTAANNRRDTTLDLYAGGRYTSLDLEVSPAGAESASRSSNWIDPIVGLKGLLPLSDRWHLAANGDIGGFGVESDFTWAATAVVGYDFHIGKQPASVIVGYRAIGQDYTDGSGDAEFKWDVVQHGPILGFALTF